MDDLRKDETIKIQRSDKGRCAVVKDTEDYIKKCKDLLGDERTYTKLVQVLNGLKEEEKISDRQHKQLHPTPETAPRFYGVPKMHKPNVPLRPIVSSIGSYNCAKHLAQLLRPLVGNTEHHVKNAHQFSELIRDVRIEEDEVLCTSRQSPYQNQRTVGGGRDTS